MSETNSPAEVLLNLVVTLLAPLFLVAANGDIAFARMAAAETVNGYRAQTQADLIIVAQIIAFGLTTLASLSQSMDPDISLPLALRLRGNANSCHRSSEQSRRALKQNQSEPKTASPPEPAPDTVELTPQTADTAAHLAGQPTQAQQDRQTQDAWAAAMTRIATETVADLDSLSPVERRSATIWATAFNACANDLRTSDPIPSPRPGDLAFMQSRASRA